jgi:hypothetical protein
VEVPINEIPCHDEAMKRTPEYAEGPEASTRFVAAMRHILAVPRDEMRRREEEYQKQAALNPNRRGPKTKKTTASPSPGVQPHA